jgi:glycosyltransferase involved in cell wall biosynthesis
MRLIIQVPCWNEEQTLPATLAALPRRVAGFDEVQVLVIDDGSTDRTAAVARAHGADHVLRLNGHQGLARAFLAGLAEAVALGADVVVNTDADNQYRAADIPNLTAPILEGKADLVVGTRPIGSMTHFSLVKRCLQRLGSAVVRRLTGADVRDAASGFRAFSRAAALRLNVFTRFTYTLETLLQAAQSGLRIASVPVGVNPPTRASRLFRGNLSYVCRSSATICQVYLIYRPGRFFGVLALTFLLPGLLLGLRYLGLMAGGEGKGHVHSLIACAVLLLSGVVAAACGVLGYLLAINRRLLEELRYRDRLRGVPRAEAPEWAAKEEQVGSTFESES